MKKLVYFAALALALAGTSCQKDEIGGTATQALAGEWVVSIDAVDANGQPIEGGEDYFGVGYVHLNTYNTAANVSNAMWIDDLASFDVAAYYGNPAYPSYSFKSVVNTDVDNLTFSSVAADNHAAVNEFGSELYKITIEDGKVLPGAAHQLNGSPCDSIVFYVKYVNDPWYPDDGYEKYRVSGIRYSGLVENEL